MSKPFKYIQDLKINQYFLTSLLILCIFKILGYIIIVSKLTIEAIFKSVVYGIAGVDIALDRDTQIKV